MATTYTLNLYVAFISIHSILYSDIASATGPYGLSWAHLRSGQSGRGFREIAGSEVFHGRGSAGALRSGSAKRNRITV